MGHNGWLAFSRQGFFVLVLLAGLVGSPDIRAQQDPGIALPCLTPIRAVTWIRAANDHDRLNRWCATVGSPVVVTRAPVLASPRTLVVVSWNVDAGDARVRELVASLRPTTSAAGGDVSVVLLLQEAIRRGADVPAVVPPNVSIPKALGSNRAASDVVALARDLNASLAYVPSMRNGRTTDPGTRADRGNAILSTELLDEITAIELPFGKQRRVAIAATVRPRGRPDLAVRVASFHFDTNGTRVGQAHAMAAYLRTMRERFNVVLAGGDVNSFWGVRDRAFVAVDAALQMEPCGTGRTNTWPLRLDRLVFFRGRIDFLFGFRPGSVDRSCRTVPSRLDSDHHPIVMTMTL